MSLTTWVMLVGTLLPTADDLQCFRTEQPEVNLYTWLQAQAQQALDRRQATYDQLQEPAQIEAYRQRLREQFVAQLGGFPARTPLRAQVVGRLPGDGYQVEKVLFESQPQHWVTANLYLPEGKGPFPGVLVSSGHSRTGKTAAYNQRFGIALAQNGIAALCYDPIGQGERSQILTPDGQPRFAGTTDEHFLVGVGAILVGRNTATYRIWDAMRGIDYLTERPDIDPNKIGMTGCSGGGTLTSYVMALDDRVACAAPACYLTTFRRLMETLGPQDAEQNVFAQLALGIDQPDYVILRAPRPTLISSTTGDFFDIRGSWDNLRQAKRIYGKLGFPERVDLVEAEGKHGVQPLNLTAIIRWFRRWLLDRDDAVNLRDIMPHGEAELLCTERGQVQLLPGARSVFDLNVELAGQLAERRTSTWQGAGQATALEQVRKLIGLPREADLPPTTWDKAGRIPREGYHVDKLVLRTKDHVPLPALTFHPREPSEEVYLYLHDGGKTADAAPGGPIEKIVEQGYVVVSVDLSGQGETAQPGARTNEMLGDWKSYYVAYLLGRPLVGLHAEDILIAGRAVAHYQAKEKEPRKVHLVAVGSTAIAALHAATLEPERFTTVTLRNAPRDWSSVVGNPLPAGRLTTTVHGALGVYDLPDLVRARRDVRFEDR